MNEQELLAGAAAAPPPVVAGGASPTGGRRRALTVFFWTAAANCAVSWIMSAVYLRQVSAAETSTFGWVHLPLAYFAHFAIIHAVLLGLGLLAALAIPPVRRWPAIYFVPVMTALHLLIYIDGVVYTNTRMHFNSAIVEMLLTPGVRDLFGFSSRDGVKFGAILAAAAAFQAALVLGAGWLADRRPGLVRALPRYGLATLAAVLAAGLAEKGLHAWADATSRRDVLVNAGTLPFYPPASCKRLARRLGLKVDNPHEFSKGLGLNYPLVPVEPPDPSPRHNILWVAIEGWRPDALAPEVSPRLSRFAERCLVGERHYSGGNCTRFGIFTMFYGLDGFYWKPMLAAQRGPALVSVLRRMDYDVLAMGSANFLNPEFRRTCFAELSDDRVVHGEALGPMNYQRDLEIARRFSTFLAGRDGSRPFFFFGFMDSTHSPYRFQELPGWKPPFSGFAEGVRHERLAGDAAERRQALVRYRNSAAYLDHIIGGMIEDLAGRGLLDKTIVMVSGDHSEEFGENGLFGHNGAFDDWQVKTPFIFHYPGVKPGRIREMTSHADWAPTVLGLLGSKADPATYCQGRDLLGPPGTGRGYAVAGSFSNAAVITDDGYRLAFPFEYYRLSTIQVYDADYRPAADRDEVLRRHGGKLAEVLRDASRFRK